MEKNNLIANRHIRVFISSTFRDMQDERNYLMKRTFPKLKKMAAERDVILTELDLRWGITEEEAKSGKVVEICMNEIENSIPFFVGIIGNRYGWIPNENDLGGNVTKRFPAVKGYLEKHLSVTEMEMQFGVLNRKEDMHAFFYIKQQEEEQDLPEMLEKLKAEVRASRYPSRDYISIENLSEQVEQDFTRLLDEVFPKGNLTAFEKEKLVQKSFISILSSTYVKDEENFNYLTKFVCESNAQNLVVTGDSGIGKSALVANWIKENSGEFNIISYFTSNGGNQTNNNISRYLIDCLSEKLGVSNIEGAEKAQLEKLFNLWAVKKEKLVIFIDAINQIVDADNAKKLDWLPFPPRNIKFIFSTLQQDKTMEVFLNRGYPVFHVKKLSEEKKLKLEADYLGSFGKKLTKAQTLRICKDVQCENTLVLRTLLDELICYGEFETLDSRIDYYLGKESVEEFYQQVIERFENDYGATVVKKILSAIVVSRNGLTEDEIIQISGVKPIDWSDFYCGFATHLNNQSGRLVFTHTYITQTVWNRYLANDADYERFCRQAIVVRLVEENSPLNNELPYQYNKLEEWDCLYKFVLNTEYFLFTMRNAEIELGSYWRNILEARKEYAITDYLSEIDAVVDKVTFYSNLIRLSVILCQEANMKSFAVKLKDLILEQPKLATASVYRTLSLSLHDTAEMRTNTREEMQESLDFAQKCLDLCKEQNDVEGEIATYMAFNSIYHYISVAFDDEDAEKKSLECIKNMMWKSREYYGESHPMVMLAYRDLGLLSPNRNEGIEYGLKAIQMAEEIYGDKHPECGRPYHYLGCLYRDLNDWETALSYFKKAYNVWLPAYGINHEMMVSSFANQGRSYQNLGQLAEARMCFQQCLDISLKIEEGKSNGYINAKLNIARIDYLMGEKRKALSACREVARLVEKRQDKDQPRYQYVLKSCNDLIRTIKG